MRKFPVLLFILVLGAAVLTKGSLILPANLPVHTEPGHIPSSAVLQSHSGGCTRGMNLCERICTHAGILDRKCYEECISNW